MCEYCSPFVEVLTSVNQIPIANRDNFELPKSKVEQFVTVFNAWFNGQCICCLRHANNYENLYTTIQSLINLTIHKLKQYRGQEILSPLPPCTTKEEFATKVDIENKTDSEGDVNMIMDNEPLHEVKDIKEQWKIDNMEMLLNFLGKVFLLNFPLYAAYKQSIQSKTEDIPQFEVTSLKEYCDLHDLEVPIHLLRNVCLFCRNGGVGAMASCFEFENLPIPVAHAMIVAGCNLKLWLNYPTILQLYVPLRNAILRYMCHMPDKQLRDQAHKSMADYMWTAIKDPMNTSVTFDRDGMELAFKYFTSTTLTMRLSGISQINAQINVFNELCNSENPDVESIGQVISSWLIDNNIVHHIFGPNMHVEVIKQSHVILTFLAMENKLNDEHIDVMWQASQLKHCSKHVYDLLLPLIKNLEIGALFHLYKLLYKLEPKDHTEQTLHLTSALMKYIWSSNAACLEVANQQRPAETTDVSQNSSSDMVKKSTFDAQEPTPDLVKNSVAPVLQDLTAEAAEKPDAETDPAQKSGPDAEQSSNTDAVKNPDSDAAQNSDTEVGTAAEVEVEITEGTKAITPPLDKSESESLFGPTPRKRRKQKKLSPTAQEGSGAAKIEYMDEQDGPLLSQKEFDSKTSNPVLPVNVPESDSCTEQEVKLLQRLGSVVDKEGETSDKDATESDSEGEMKQDQEVPVGELSEIIGDILSGDDMSISSQISNKSDKILADFDGEEDSGCDDVVQQGSSSTAQDVRRQEYKKRLMGKLTSAPESQEVNVITQYDLNDVCKPGNTLLWDLIQDNKITQLGEGLALEAEKALCNLLTSGIDQLIRMKFIEGCLDNLAKNESVLISLRLLPKLFSSFRGSSMTPSDVALWALDTQGMTKRFFQNLRSYLSRKEPQAIEIQVRLQFLSHIYSSGCLPDVITLTIQDIDTLWNFIVTHPTIADEMFSWFLQQAKAKEQHALGLEALRHLFTKKLPSLDPESISTVALSLYQELCNMATVTSEQVGALSREGDVLAMDHMWKIALRASNAEVSYSAIQYLNSYYVGHKLLHVKDFIRQCMAHLGEATASLSSDVPISLLYIQRALILLKTHIDIFRRRYSYHVRRWALEGWGMEGFHRFSTFVDEEKPSVPFTLTVKPANYSDKLVLVMRSSDYVADFRAEVSFWWEKHRKSQQSNLTGGGRILLADGPIRIIANGQEITPEFDEKTLKEINFKDTQVVYISVGAIRGRKKDMDCPSSHPPPPEHCIPTLMLLTPHYFEQLFTLMIRLSEMKPSDNEVRLKAQGLSRRVWDILTLLPTNPSLLLGFHQVKTVPRLPELLDPSSTHKLMYSLHIIDNIMKGPLSSAALKSTPTRDKAWVDLFMRNGGLEHMFKIFMSGVLKPTGGGGNEWEQDCLACLLKILYELPADVSDTNIIEIDKHRGQAVLMETLEVIRLHDVFMVMIDGHSVIDRLTNILCEATSQDSIGSKIIVFGKSQVIKHALHFFMALSYSDPTVCTRMCAHPQFGLWLLRLLLEEAEPKIRNDVINALYGLEKPFILLPYLVDLLPTAISMKNPNVPPPSPPPPPPPPPPATPSPQPAQGQQPQQVEVQVKEPFGASCKDYFWLTCKLVDSLLDKTKLGPSEEMCVDYTSLVKCVHQYILERETLESRSRLVDQGLIGLLNLMASILKHNPVCKTDKEAPSIIEKTFDLVFELPNPQRVKSPKCKSKLSRSAAFEVLVEMVRGSLDNYTIIYDKLLLQHQPGPNSPYPWDYWPQDDGRAECGYVGLTNLGATCYMASCVQHLFMMPYVRHHILTAKPEEANKHHSTLRELQRMFAFLLESERKAYNPASFCKAYTMDHQPLNTGEQKDMAEFFIDLVSKLEEMTPQLKTMVKSQFGGVLSNDVVSLDCDHVSCTLEEFYTVRCQVANMRNIYDSLTEVTVKDTLVGDNMYTCSQCGKKVRAEKRACFKKLPKVLCFNTMRYTFNMLTMMKEKVNTHFSFPFQLDMSGYVQKHLIPQHYQGEQTSSDFEMKEPANNAEYKYDLIGVTVHTGTADGGHYYCFIRDAVVKDKWFLFNDAEVKLFDANQIPAECFGGEMFNKSYDSMNEKFMDLSFEKSNSAYMLFYERSDVCYKTESDGSVLVEYTKDSSPCQLEPIKLADDLESYLWEDNVNFIRDKCIFESTYFQFMWQMCSILPPTLENPSMVKEKATRLLTTFFLETFIHAKEKPTMVQWVELLTKQFTSSHESGEWFLTHMANDNWWPMQILIKCSNQMVRQMFHRLCIHVIQGLRQKHYPLYVLEAEAPDQVKDKSCVTMFIRMLLALLESGAKNYMRNLTEYFALLNDFCKMGEEEMKFLISINAISTMISFYMGTRPKDCLEATSEEDEVEESIPTEKYKPASLERMITLIATLVEKSRGPDHTLHLSRADYAAFTGGKCFPFLNQQIKDGINLYQTRNLILSLCKWNERLAAHIVSMIFTSIHKNTENCQSFFKLVTYLTECGSSPGLPCFTQLVISHVWDVAAVCPLAALEWLASQTQRSKLTHSWLLQSMDTWVEHYLVAHSNQRVRSAAAYLLVCMVPNLSFRQIYRSGRMAKEHHNMNTESLSILHQIYGTLLRMLKNLRPYTDIAIHGAAKLHIYFTLLNYFAFSRTEKIMFEPYLLDLWQLFHPKLSEPGISVHHNKQALLHFWFSVSCECPENVQLILQNAHIVKNLAYNYILADHDDQEVVAFNRAMLPAYYGLLRLCCQQSRSFTRQLATHQNITWAFKNISPHPTQYPTAVEELFKLMHLFVSKYSDSSEQELDEINNFRKQTLQLFLQVLDGRSCFTTLITAIKLLAENIEDKLHILYHGGLQMCFESFHTLHAMYHEATACHVSGDLIELMTIIQDLVKTLHQVREPKDVRSVLLSCKDWVDTIRKIPTLLNTYNSPEIRNASIDLLKELILAAPDEVMHVLVPLLSHCHAAFQENTNPIPMGTYYPRQRIPHTTVKNMSRPFRPMLQMGISHSQLEVAKGIDAEYDQALSAFYFPYHSFIDVMCRLAVNNDCMSETLVNLSAMIGYEAVPLHFTFFPKLWLDIHQAQNVDRKYIIMLTNSSYFVDYVEAALVDWRSCLNVSVIYDFLTVFFPKVASQVLTDQTCTLMESIVTNLAGNINKIVFTTPQYKLISDLRALALVYSKDLPVVPPPELLPTIQELSERLKQAQKTYSEDGESSSTPSPNWIESLQGTVNSLLASLQEKVSREDHP